ncbi:MAG: cytochrome c [Microthrixaceae bacterium]
MTTQRSIAYVIAAVILVGGAFFVFTQIFKGRRELGSEIELAPNRKPYLPDEELEGPKLNKALWTSLGLLAVVAVVLPLYWLAEPSRESGAVEHYRELFAERGLEMFTTGAQCVNCHGTNAAGGSASYVITDENGKYVKKVTWTAPGLQTVLYRFSTAEVMDILTYGRPGTPMPAWGIAGGGPNTDQQLHNVIQYLWTVQLTPTQMRKAVDDAVKAADPGLYDRMIEVRAANRKVTDPTSAEFTRLAKHDELRLGEILFYLNDPNTDTDSYACARCHVPGFSFGEPWEPVSSTARGRFAFNLIGIENVLTEKQQFALVSNGSEEGKQYGSMGLGTGRMPGFGTNANDQQPDDVRKFGQVGMLSPEQVWAVITYTETSLRSDPTCGSPPRRSPPPLPRHPPKPRRRRLPQQEVSDGRARHDRGDRLRPDDPRHPRRARRYGGARRFDLHDPDDEPRGASGAARHPGRVVRMDVPPVVGVGDLRHRLEGPRPRMGGHRHQPLTGHPVRRRPLQRYHPRRPSPTPRSCSISIPSCTRWRWAPRARSTTRRRSPS